MRYKDIHLPCFRHLTLESKVQAQSRSRPLIVISGFIHDMSDFLDQHPGGRRLLVQNIGKDATASFLGGVYDHSHAAQNVR